MCHFLKFKVVSITQTVTATINMIPVNGNISRKALYMYVWLVSQLEAGSFWPVTLNSLWTHEPALLSSHIFLWTWSLRFPSDHNFYSQSVGGEMIHHYFEDWEKCLELVPCRMESNAAPYKCGGSEAWIQHFKLQMTHTAVEIAVLKEQSM